MGQIHRAGAKGRRYAWIWLAATSMPAVENLIEQPLPLCCASQQIWLLDFRSGSNPVFGRRLQDVRSLPRSGPLVRCIRSHSRLQDPNGDMPPYPFHHAVEHVAGL